MVGQLRGKLIDPFGIGAFEIECILSMQPDTCGKGKTLVADFLCDNMFEKIGQFRFGRFERSQVEALQFLQIGFELFHCAQRWIIVMQILKAKDPADDAGHFERDLLRSSQLVDAAENETVKTCRQLQLIEGIHIARVNAAVM